MAEWLQCFQPYLLPSTRAERYEGNLKTVQFPDCFFSVALGKQLGERGRGDCLSVQKAIVSQPAFPFLQLMSGRQNFALKQCWHLSLLCFQPMEALPVVSESQDWQEGKAELGPAEIS